MSISSAERTTDHKLVLMLLHLQQCRMVSRTYGTDETRGELALDSPYPLDCDPSLHCSYRRRSEQLLLRLLHTPLHGRAMSTVRPILERDQSLKRASVPSLREQVLDHDILCLIVEHSDLSTLAAWLATNERLSERALDQLYHDINAACLDKMMEQATRDLAIRRKRSSFSLYCRL